MDFFKSTIVNNSAFSIRHYYFPMIVTIYMIIHVDFNKFRLLRYTAEAPTPKPCSGPSPDYRKQFADAFNLKILHECPQVLCHIRRMFLDAFDHL